MTRTLSLPERPLGRFAALLLVGGALLLGACGDDTANNTGGQQTAPVQPAPVGDAPAGQAAPPAQQ